MSRPLQDRRLRLARDSEMRPYARHELVERERLGHVVGSAFVETFDLVPHLIAGGEQDHREGGLVAANSLEDLEAVPSREHHVEHDERHLLGARDGLAPLAVPDARDGVALRLEPALEEVGDSRLVFDYEDPHQAGC